jgi:hypothetical protein
MLSYLPNASIVIGRAEAADMTGVTESAWGGGNYNAALLQKIPLCMRLGIRGGISSMGAREFEASHYYSEQKNNAIHPHPSPPPSRGREVKEGTSFRL